MPARVPPGLEMVAHHDRVEADAFRVDPELEKLARVKLFGGGFVAKLQHIVLLKSC
jgi:hypothetical protein